MTRHQHRCCRQTAAGTQAPSSVRGDASDTTKHQETVDYSLNHQVYMKMLLPLFYF